MTTIAEPENQEIPSQLQAANKFADALQQGSETEPSFAEVEEAIAQGQTREQFVRDWHIQHRPPVTAADHALRQSQAAAEAAQLEAQRALDAASSIDARWKKLQTEHARMSARVAYTNQQANDARVAVEGLTALASSFVGLDSLDSTRRFHEALEGIAAAERVAKFAKGWLSGAQRELAEAGERVEKFAAEHGIKS